MAHPENKTARTDKSSLYETGFLVVAFSTVIGVMGLGVVNVVGQNDIDGARKALEENGVQNIEITGKAGFWDCRSATPLRSSFTGEINGTSVKGAVCKNWLEPANIRFKTASPDKP